MLHTYWTQIKLECYSLAFWHHSFLCLRDSVYYWSGTEEVLVTQLHLALCQPMDWEATVPGILQARILERVAIPFSRLFPWPRDQTQVSRIAGRVFTVWTTRETHYQIVFVKDET